MSRGLDRSHVVYRSRDWNNGFVSGYVNVHGRFVSSLVNVTMEMTMSDEVTVTKIQIVKIKLNLQVHHPT